MKKTVTKITYLFVCIITIAFILAGCGAKESSKSSKEDKFKDIRGGWNSTSVGGSYWVFDKDDNFYWYKSSDDLEDNYYKGKMTKIYKGQDAADDLGITEDKIKTVLKNSKGKVTIDNIYAFHLKPTYLISGGVDKSSTLKDSSEMKMLFVYIDENSAQAMNINSGDTYYLTKLDK